jgi:folate-binding protein YgfZ
MLEGVVTGRIPLPLRQVEPGVESGRAEYSVVLTPKGRTVSDLRLLPADGDAGEGRTFLADVPQAGAKALLAHLGRYLPPRFCAVEDRSDRSGHLTVLGPGAAGVVARVALGLRVDPETLGEMPEGDLRRVDAGGEVPLTVIRCGEVSEPAFDVIGDAETIAALRARLVEAGVVPVGSGVWEALRLEAGRPAFGDDLTDENIPIEAGVHTRAIDYEKGCYTGQEVIIRIRDRGHVNRHLRRLRLGDAPTPAAGTEIWIAGRERAAGRITSAAASPRDGTLALAYLRREAEVPGTVRLGAPDGPEVEVEALPGA